MNEADLQVNIEGVRKHAFKKGISDPKVFALSAKREQEGDHASSGFGKLNDYIRGHITNLNAYKLKPRSTVSTSRNLHARLETTLKAMEDQLKADRDFRADIHHYPAGSGRKITKTGRCFNSQYAGGLRSDLRLKVNKPKAMAWGSGSLPERALMSVFSKADSPRKLVKKPERELEQDLTKNLTTG